MPYDTRPEQYGYPMRQFPQTMSPLMEMLYGFREHTDQKRFREWESGWIDMATRRLGEIGGERARDLGEELRRNPALVHMMVKQSGGWPKLEQTLMAEQRQAEATRFLAEGDPEMSRQERARRLGGILGDVRQGQAAEAAHYQAGLSHQRPTFRGADGYLYYADGRKERVKPGIEKPETGGPTGAQQADNDERLWARNELMQWIQSNEKNRATMRTLIGGGEDFWMMKAMKDSEEGYAARLWNIGRHKLVSADDPGWQPFLDAVVGIGKADTLPRLPGGAIDRTRLVKERAYTEGGKDFLWDGERFAEVE